jgi:tetratricopeptide (TPR) repeat protein
MFSMGAKRPDTDFKTEKEADKQWKAGNYAEAEKLYRKAYANSGFIYHLLPLARNKFSIGDIKGANILYSTILKEKLTIKHVALPDQMNLHILFREKINSNFARGDREEGIATTLQYMESMSGKLTAIERGHFQPTFLSAATTAFSLNDRAALLKLYETASGIKNAEYGEFIGLVYLALLDKDYDKAISKIDDVLKNGAGFTFSKTTAINFLPLIYAYKGENDLALESIRKATGSILVGEDHFQYVYGLIAMSKKDYSEAVKRFTEVINFTANASSFVKQGNPGTSEQVLYNKFEPVGKYNHYSKRAEAYLGQGNLIQAKKDFEAALAYNASYEPALNGIALLEGKMIRDQKSDKTPPVIVITEPSANRGLKVTTSGNNIMIRGKATDAAGLKSVTLNGQLIYSKNDGDFWGNVSLANGSNKVTVIATDLAGNAAEDIFEIEKVKVVNANADIVPIVQKEGKNYAVLIASQNYDDSAIPSLENPIPDAVKLKMILKNSYNFSEENVLTLFNPERADFRKKFLQLTEILQPEDNLIIFYAGHGIWVEKEKKGYWLLTDAKRNDVNTWLPNREVLNMIANVPSRNTLLITDACFSGSVFKTRSIGADAPPGIREMSEKISRVAITSGNDTEVPDVSVFMKYLVKALNENKEKYLTAQKMFITQIIEAVMAESKTEPRYGTLELAGHVGGDFIFTKK